MDSEERAALIADGYDPDDPEILAEDEETIALLRAHMDMTTEPGPLRAWYRTSGLTELPARPDRHQTRTNVRFLLAWQRGAGWRSK